MYLVWFLTIGAVISIVLGEFGQYPFGASFSVSLTDFLISFSVLFLLIWKVGIKKELQFNKPLVLLILFWLAGLISLVVSGSLSGGFYLIRYVIYSLYFYVGFEIVRSRVAGIENIVLVIIFSGLAILAAGFLQLIFFPDMAIISDFGYDPHRYRLVSTFLDPNFSGAFLNICLALVIWKYISTNKKVWLIPVVLFGVAVFLTFSRSAYLMALIEVVIIGIFRARKMLGLFALVAVLAFIIVPRFNERVVGAFRIDVTAWERIESWNKGISVFKKNPVFGVGFNNLREAYTRNNLNKVFSSDGGNSGAGVDSSLIFVLATTGVAGLFLYILFWFEVLRKIVLNFHKDYGLVIMAIILGLFADSLFINSLFFTPIICVIYLLLGGFYGSND